MLSIARPQKNNRPSALLVIISTILCLLSVLPVAAETFYTVGGEGDEQIIDMAFDPDGNKVILVAFTNKTVLRDSTGDERYFESNGATDFYIAVYDTAGRFIWTDRKGGEYDDIPHDLDIDSEGNIYVAGYSYGEISFGPDLVSANTGFIAMAKKDGVMTPTWEWNWTRNLLSNETETNDSYLAGPALSVYRKNVYVAFSQVDSGTDAPDSVAGRHVLRRIRVDEDTTNKANPGDAIWDIDLFDAPAWVLATQDKIFVSGFKTPASREPSCTTSPDLPIQNGRIWISVYSEKISSDGSHNISCDSLAVILGATYEIHYSSGGYYVDMNSWRKLRNQHRFAVSGKYLYFATDSFVEKYDHSELSHSQLSAIKWHTNNFDIFRDSSAFDIISRSEGESNYIYLSGAYINSAPARFGAYELPAGNGLSTPFLAKLKDNEDSASWEWANAPVRTGEGWANGDEGSIQIALDAAGQVHFAAEILGLASFSQGDDIRVFNSFHTDPLSGRFEFNYDTGVEFQTQGFVLSFPDDADDFIAPPVIYFQGYIKIETGGFLFELSDTESSNALLLELESTQNPTQFKIVTREFETDSEVWHESRWDSSPLPLRNGDWHYLRFWRNIVSDATGTYIQYRVELDSKLVINKLDDSCPICAQNFKNPDYMRFGQFSGIIDDPQVHIAGSNQALRGSWPQVDITTGKLKNQITENTVGKEIRLPDLQLTQYQSLAMGYYSPIQGNNRFPRDLLFGQADPTNGDWLIPQAWTVGEGIAPPGGAAGEMPEIEISGMDVIKSAAYFSWNKQVGKLFPVGVAGGVVTLRWKLENAAATDTERMERKGVLKWPETGIQNHVSGAPARLDSAKLPDSEPLVYSRIAYPSGATEITSTDSSSGATWFRRALEDDAESAYTVLEYFKTNSDPPNHNDHEPYYLVVKTRSWREFVGNSLPEDATIGQPITHSEHQASHNGHVVSEYAPIDASGADKAFDRATRTGPIIPVNTKKEDDPDFVVAWYRQNALGMHWPDLAVEYNPKWPATPSQIIIANQQGSGEKSPAEYRNARIYNQPVRTNDSGQSVDGFNPNEEHALILETGAGFAGFAVYALRDDLNEKKDHSKPYVLLKYQDAAAQWRFEVFQVCATSSSCVNDPRTRPKEGFSKADGPAYAATAGSLVQPPTPLLQLGVCKANDIANNGDPDNAGWVDYAGNFYARAANPITIENDVVQTQNTTILHYYYPLRASFFYDFDETPGPDAEAGTCIRWLNYGGENPIDVHYTFSWPQDAPVLRAGESLLSPKNGLPAINGQKAVQVIFDEASHLATKDGTAFSESTPLLVRLYDPVSERSVTLKSLAIGNITRRNGRVYFPDLPATLRSRLSYDEGNEKLIFSGSIHEPPTGDPQILPNIMTATERDKIKALEGADRAFEDAVDALYHLTRNPNGISLDQDGNPDKKYLVGYQVEPKEGGSEGETISPDISPDKVAPQRLINTPAVLSAGHATQSGYVTLAFNNDESLGLPVSLEVIRVVADNLYAGNLWIVPSDNVFEESLTLRHSGDFGGDPDRFCFEWYYQSDSGGQPEAPTNPTVFPWLPQDSGKGKIDTTINGPGVKTLTDNWFVARYRLKPDDKACDQATGGFSGWAGDPSQVNPPKALLAQGWIKRVTNGLNPFDSRVKDFHVEEVNTLTSMIAQAGPPYAGPIPFNPDGDVINSIGMIEAYETVFRRGKDLSIEWGIDHPAANTALLYMATRIGDLYTLLGNEAYADAQDPTIGFDTSSLLGSRASSVFTFQNILATPLEEELVLLRGRDDSRAGVQAPPLYNRLPWNFTLGDGEVVYQQAYAISDQTADGFINENDAAVLFPQGHGDAWGHYLTAAKMRYDLLRHPHFTWIPRTESVLLGGGVVEVDYLDERKFATTAAAKARTGAELVNLTYREQYVEDPAGQWQGYLDTDPDRAWGLDGWARRAGQGAWFDWLTVNAILPAEDPDPNHTGIERIDRTTVAEIRQIAAQFSAIQGQADKADAGLNPLGLAKGVVPFDIDPNFDTPGASVQGQPHFEQVANRALAALGNTVRVFDHASQLSQQLRLVQDDVDQLRRTVMEQEQDYKNRLIEIFGYPYANDPAYPSGYDGPDLLNFMYVSSELLTEENLKPDATMTAYYSPMNFGEGEHVVFPDDVGEDVKLEDFPGAQPNDAGDNLVIEVGYPVANNPEWKFVADPAWGDRRATGELQTAISELLQAQMALGRARSEHRAIKGRIERDIALIQAEHGNYLKEKEILAQSLAHTTTLNAARFAAYSASKVLEHASEVSKEVAQATSQALPTSVGLSNDITAPARALTSVFGITAASGAKIASITADAVETGLGFAQEVFEKSLDFRLTVETDNTALLDRINALESLVRQELALRLTLFQKVEALNQSQARVSQLADEGVRLWDERTLFRVMTSESVQENRYRDMTFRIFRNDALQKYRAQFDLAARYIYLAAAAYDYETNLLPESNGSGRDFLADIVRQRSLGEMIDGQPIIGSIGLADLLGRMVENFAVYKGQLGFNNPQTETNRFSLRREHFRVTDDPEHAAEAEAEWRKRLANARVEDLWEVPEFRRFARPFAPERYGPQPGLMIRFDTEVTFGKNFFGENLAGGDSAYDPTNFATKVRSVGVWFEGYDKLNLSNTPRIYLFPAGTDKMRAPDSRSLAVRSWQVFDQKIPAPFPIGATELNDLSWIPISDSLSETFADIRRFSSFRAYHDSGVFDQAETVTDSRLIGRSVWNDNWVLIIPGGTLLFDAEAGLEQFVNGVTDIKLFFQTYGYSGN